LDDLDKGSPYKTMDRSIFMNPESVNARVVIPISTYAQVVSSHKVDFFLYANNYEDKLGVRIENNPAEIKQVFVEGKRMAMQTTEESGLSLTYFANPFGPLQHPDLCGPLIDKYFELLCSTGVKMGEVYTGLGVKDAREGHLNQTAQKVLALLIE